MLECAGFPSWNVVCKRVELDCGMLLFDSCQDCGGQSRVISNVEIMKKVRRENPVQSSSSFGCKWLKAVKGICQRFMWKEKFE